jgi:hypothetical protein
VRYFRPRFGLEIFPVACPGLTGLIGSRADGAIEDIGFKTGAGFNARETVEAGFFGMPEEYAPLDAGNKA